MPPSHRKIENAFSVNVLPYSTGIKQNSAMRQPVDFKLTANGGSYYSLAATQPSCAMVFPSRARIHYCVKTGFSA